MVKIMEWKYENGRIYSVNENNEVMAEATYVEKQNGEIEIDHVYVNEVLRGQGVADKTMKVVTEYLRDNNLKATASCSYANSWFKKHVDEYSDIIADSIDNQVVACKIDGKH
jgi:predicted GNAT family acetyltransferase